MGRLTLLIVEPGFLTLATSRILFPWWRIGRYGRVIVTFLCFLLCRFAIADALFFIVAHCSPSESNGAGTEPPVLEW